jgi:hypothetical protein
MCAERMCLKRISLGLLFGKDKKCSELSSMATSLIGIYFDGEQSTSFAFLLILIKGQGTMSIFRRHGEEDHHSMGGKSWVNQVIQLYDIIYPRLMLTKVMRITQV